MIHQKMLAYVTSIFFLQITKKNTKVENLLTVIQMGVSSRGVLKPNTVPSVWPGCPEHLSKRTIERPTKMATSTAREENDSRIRKNLIEMQTLQDAFNSLDELDANSHLYFFFYLLTY